MMRGMEIAPNIYCIPAGYVNMYLFADEAGWTLIDAGTPRKQNLIFDSLAELGQPPEALKRIIITHTDIDHVGSLAAIQARSGATVLASKETKPYLLSGKTPEHMPALMQTFINIFMKFKPVPEATIQLIADGDRLPYLGGLEVIRTFGHTLEHYSFYSPMTGVLFAGDALSTRNGRIQSSPKRVTADQDYATQSAIKLLEMAPATLACGHGPPMSNFSTKEIMDLFNQLRQEKN